MKIKPDRYCPLCFRLHYSRQQIIDCMEKDLAEARAKERILRLIGVREKI